MTSESKQDVFGLSIVDAASVIDEIGMEQFLYRVFFAMNNPRESHIAGRLLDILKDNESLLITRKPVRLVEVATQF